MIGRGTAWRAIERMRDADTRLRRQREPEMRHVVLDAKTAMEYAMMAPVHRALAADPRIRVSCMSSQRPDQWRSIYREPGTDGCELSPRRALLSKVDVYLVADLLWATLPRGAQRVQMFHGVAGKYSNLYDRPSDSMRTWHRLFFINRRRLRNFINAGAIDPDSPAARLIGIPQVACLVDGTLQRDAILADAGIDPSARTVLYAPTWTAYSSLNAMGESLVEALGAAGFTVLVKLHENSRDLRHENSGGIDWPARLRPLLDRSGGRLIDDGNAAPWMAAADVLITDHSSVGFEYLLLDRPLIRIEMPALIARTSIPPEYVQMMVDSSTSTRDVPGTVRAVEEAFANPATGSSARRIVAGELFHEPGTATKRAVAEIYAMMELSPAAAAADAADRWREAAARDGGRAAHDEESALGSRSARPAGSADGATVRQAAARRP
jgi:hypothetical protein